MRDIYERVLRRRPALVPVLLIFALSRLAFYAAAIPGAYLLPDAPNQPAAVDVNARLALALHWRWDAVHYYTVSIDGYSEGGTTAFFPLLPLLMHVASFVLGGFQAPAHLPIQQAETTTLLAGVLVAHAISLLAFWLLYQLASEELGDRDAAIRTVLYAAFFPLAFHYGVPYTEGLLLATAAGTFLAARRRQWVRAGIWAGLGAASRSSGILLTPVLLLEIGLAWRRGGLTRAEQPRALLGLLLAPLGLLLFMAELWNRTGDPFAFIEAQKAWGRESTWPWTTLLRGIDYALHPAMTDRADVYMRGVMHLLITLAFLAILIGYARRWRPSYTLFGGLLFVLILASPIEGQWTMHHLGRFLMPFFPIYFVLAGWGRHPWVDRAILATFLPLFGLLTLLYVNWYAV
ncbi:MAG TPA: glycosyltransferase family 39 protein [Thermomicrobiales bacterium]|nr:glycosyltransferase family 39 protein [Thermomicrobiales bacterium]